jgi:hypothetical protein
MELVNETPFCVARLFWADLEGRPRLTVVVKATFAIKPGQAAVVAAKQLPILSVDEQFSDDPNATVRFESDLVPIKPRADVILVGKAHTPDGRPVTELDVTLKVGSLRKVLRVFGNRKWRFATRLSLVPSITPPEPFTTMDLVYERAFGGIDRPSAQYCKENLVGKGLSGNLSWESVHDKEVPNLEDPDDLIQTPRSRPRPVGFGFYGRGWMPRLAYAGTYDERYRKERAPATPLDFSYAFFNGAHPDLQVEGYLRGDEWVELENLSPQPRLRFRLPGMRPKVTVSRWTVPPGEWIRQDPGAERPGSGTGLPLVEESVAAALDTLVLVPDEGIFYLVFRGACPLTALDASEVARIKVTS